MEIEEQDNTINNFTKKYNFQNQGKPIKTQELSNEINKDTKLELQLKGK